MSQLIVERKLLNETKLFAQLQNDLWTLIGESKKKFPLIKEACEEGIAKIRNAQGNPQTPLFYIVNQILYPFVQGCETKDPKIVKICLAMIQRLITEQVVDQKAARCISDTLWMLMEAAIEEVKVLQSVTLLLTTNCVVHGDVLAKNLVLCFRLHFAKDATLINAAGATTRQLVSLVFERLITEMENSNEVSVQDPIEDITELRNARNIPPKGLTPTAADAYLLFQDLVLLVNADQPCWLSGMTEMSRVFGLELLEMILVKFTQIFYKYPQFRFLLKEHVCALVIKLFSPNIKFRSTSATAPTHQQDKPNFAVSVRLCRVVEILVHRYQALLATECEIFVSLIVKFLDDDKPTWQRSLALEVLCHWMQDPAIVKSICTCYDLRQHATNVFQDICQALGGYVHSTLTESGNNVSNGHHTSVATIGPGSSAQPGFFSRGHWLPLIPANGSTRSTYMDMLDKVEAPHVADSYGLSVAYTCLLDMISSIASVVEMCTNDPNLDDSVALRVQLITSSWTGLLSALSALVETSTDEVTTDNILKSMSNYVGLCCLISPELEAPREAFVMAVCRACLPPQYGVHVFKPSNVSNSSGPGYSIGDTTSQYNLPGYGIESDYRPQVVAVGTLLPTANLPLGAQQGPVMLTSKNVQCMKALLDLAHDHGAVLVKSWHLVLTTLQHLVWILRLKPSTGGCLKATKSSGGEHNAVIATAVMADLPVLSRMLSRLFESSVNLDEVSLHHLIHALCQLSQEAMELAYSNREPSLFAVAKLLETGLMNLSRIEVFWRPLTSHLLEVCQHPHIRMREWGVEAITYLLKVALQHNKYTPPLRSNQALQTLILLPLSELSCVPHADVRLRQLDCLLYVLHLSGDTLCYGWPLVLNTIAAVSDFHGENLIRLAFQCLQLIVTDFLPVMPWNCLPHCVNTAAKFGSQTRELNISLTAVGLMWNISDYFYQNHEKLTQSLVGDTTVLPDFPGNPHMPAFDKLMHCLFTKLGELCVDSRPAVRKSAGQTLFATIGAHGGLLSEKTWSPVLCQVLFPLLDKVRMSSDSASSEKVDTGSILIHHSRNTAQKQWAETQVLTVLGVSKVFETKLSTFQQMGDFGRYWSMFMEYLESTALSYNDEVSLAGLKAFQEILFWRIKAGAEGGTDVQDVADLPKEDAAIRVNAWQVWLNLGCECTTDERCRSAPPTQQFLTALIQLFPDVFLPIRSRFSKSDLKKLGEVLRLVLLVPPIGENIFIICNSTDPHITHLQDGVLDCIELIAMGSTVDEEGWPLNIKNMIDLIFDQLVVFAKFSNWDKSMFLIPTTSEVSPQHYVPFVERTIEVIGWLYERCGHTDLALETHVLDKVMDALEKPMSTKHNSAVSSSLWKLSSNCFIRVLKVGIPLARNNPEHFTTFWVTLGRVLEDFLFAKCPTNGENRNMDDWKTGENVDCQIIELIRTHVLDFHHQVPREFLLQVAVILNMGSMHSVSQSDSYLETSSLREDLAKICFETLLDFSLMGDDQAIAEVVEVPNAKETSVVGRLAVTSLLHRFQSVLQRFIDDDKASGKCPLPRYQVSEVSFVLKAISTLVQSLKKASPDKVGEAVWQQLIDLYPSLVQCTTVTSAEITQPLKEALMQYFILLKPKNF